MYYKHFFRNNGLNVKLNVVHFCYRFLKHYDWMSDYMVYSYAVDWTQIANIFPLMSTV